MFRSIGADVTNDEYEEYLARLETFSKWFDKTVMSLNSGSDDAVMILPSGIAGRKYRDEPPQYVVNLPQRRPSIILELVPL